MELFTLDRGKAKKADNLSIAVGGVYESKITSADIGTTDRGAKYVNFNFSTPVGDIKFVKIYYKNADGTVNFGENQINSLMALLRLDSVSMETKTENGKTVEFIPEFINREILTVLMREDYYKQDGTIGYMMKLLHFCSMKTKQTYSEACENLDAKVFELPVVDKRLSPKKEEQKTEFDDDLPF